MILSIKKFIVKLIFVKILNFLGRKRSVWFILNILNNTIFKGKSKKYYVFRRFGNNGIFSSYLEILGILNELEKISIPMSIDLGFYFNELYHKSETEKYNFWDSYFLQPHDIDKLKRYPINNFPKLFLDFKTSRNLFDVNQLISFSKLSKRYLRLNQETNDFVNNKLLNLFNKDDEVIGVNIRENFTIGRPKNHPIQPDIMMIKEDIDKILQTHKVNKIFVASDNFEQIEILIRKYGKMIVYIERPRIGDKRYKNNIKNKTYTHRSAQQIKNNEALLLEIADFGRLNEIEEKTKEYISEIYGLARCQHLVAGVTSGSSASVIINGGRYKTIKFYNLGLY